MLARQVLYHLSHSASPLSRFSIEGEEILAIGLKKQFSLVDVGPLSLIELNCFVRITPLKTLFETTNLIALESSSGRRIQWRNL
jgi:hypothetical protein